MSANLIRHLCEAHGVPFAPFIASKLAARLAAKIEIIGRMDAHSWNVLVATEIDDLPNDEWVLAMTPVAEEFERRTKTAGYVLKIRSNESWQN